MKTLSRVVITHNEVLLNGQNLEALPLTALYRKYVGDYPKFFKMDSLCKLGFLAAELLLKDKPIEEKENAAIILFNRNGSLITDRNYQKTITDDNYFPSPALFVYTLSNIVTGEIAIRHKIYGESSFYVMPGYDEAKIDEIVSNAFLTSSPTFILTGWVDYNDEEDYLANLKLVTN
jgi:3-oxoacyl-[acyl-carrier-protein] synthase-1